ncbi:MAG: hypothetical protein IKA72_00040 [Clostridia bacterium]|nr:hypothetical protein [Clostridia bacterium]
MNEKDETFENKKNGEDELEMEVVLEPVKTPTPDPISEGTPAHVKVTMPETMPFGSVIEEIEEKEEKSELSETEQKKEQESV